MRIFLSTQKRFQLRDGELASRVRGGESVKECQTNQRGGHTKYLQNNWIVKTQRMNQTVSKLTLLMQYHVVGAGKLAQVTHGGTLLGDGTHIRVTGSQQRSQQERIASVIFGTSWATMGQDIRRCHM